MITLIYGGSGSGKSQFAEDYICKKSKSNKYYLATMAASDKESLARIEKHRRARAGKGFETIECPYDIDTISVEKGANILLECLSNLVANEMFRDGKIIPSEECIQKIYDNLLTLKDQTDLFVIVTNNIYEDGVTYDKSTEDYLLALGRVNAKLAELATEVYEVIVGIPVKIKG